MADRTADLKWTPGHQLNALTKIIRDSFIASDQCVVMSGNIKQNYMKKKTCLNSLNKKNVYVKILIKSYNNLLMSTFCFGMCFLGKKTPVVSILTINVHITNKAIFYQNSLVQSFLHDTLDFLGCLKRFLDSGADMFSSLL